MMEAKIKIKKWVNGEPWSHGMVTLGNGYDIKRLSASTHETYFYSAALTGPYVVRVAVPYSAELTRSLQIDHSYIWYALAVSIILVIILYRYTQRIGSHIGYLREFAVMAENGEALDHELERRLPDDELGDISHTIITLYWKLRHSEEEKIRIKRQLTQNAAHELKTPAKSTPSGATWIPCWPVRRPSAANTSRTT